MKRLFLLLSLFAVTLGSAHEPLQEIRDVLQYVESNNNPDALGDYVNGKPKAYGKLQIHKIAVDDVNRVYGTNFTHEDAFNEQCAEKIFDLYITFWSKQLEKREGRPATTLDIVRIWNGGPMGYEKHSTIYYMRKYLDYRKNRYLCENGEQPEMFNRWETGNHHQKVYTYRRCLYVQNT